MPKKQFTENATPPVKLCEMFHTWQQAAVFLTFCLLQTGPNLTGLLTGISPRTVARVYHRMRVLGMMQRRRVDGVLERTTLYHNAPYLQHFQRRAIEVMAAKAPALLRKIVAKTLAKIATGIDDSAPHNSQNAQAILILLRQISWYQKNDCWEINAPMTEVMGQ